jgi:hypothetical protein
MPESRRIVLRLLEILCAATFVALLGLGLGCSKDDLIPQGDTTSLYGTYAETSGASGIIDLAGQAAPSAAHLVQAQTNAFALTGTVTIGGTSIPVSGVYDPDTGSIFFEDDNQLYTFQGTVVAGQATGVSIGPNGGGTFTLFLGGTSASVPTYCGTVLCTTPVDCTATGTFNVAVSGSTALMTASYDGSVGVGAGTAAGSTVSFHIVNNQYGVDINIDGEPSGGNITGTWTDNNNGYAGTWDGSTAQCTAAR